MRILILNTDYDLFLEDFYGRDPELSRASYEEQLRARNGSLFGVADSYSRNLRALGHEAWELHTNNHYLQAAWAREHSVPLDPAVTDTPRWHSFLQSVRRRAGQTSLRHIKRLLRPFLHWLDARNDWLYGILARQLEHHRADVIVNQSIDGISNRFLAEHRGGARLLVGQIAAPIPDDGDLSFYDLMLSSLPNYVDRFRGLGLRAELHPFAFDPLVLEAVPARERDSAVSFIGSASIHHHDRVELLEALCRQGVPIEIWGQGVETISRHSPIRQHHHGPVWGGDMYAVLARSRVTLNHHIGIAGEFCNNMRLFEATGMGAALLTDAKSNLGDYFEVGAEVLAYESTEQCLELITSCLADPVATECIGAAGQARVIRDHSYPKRMGELATTLRNYL